MMLSQDLSIPLENLVNTIDHLPRKVAQTTLTCGMLHRIVLITEILRLPPGFHITPGICP